MPIVQRQVGHKSLKTTSVYLRPSDEQVGEAYRDARLKNPVSSKKGKDLKVTSNSLAHEEDVIQLVQQIHRFSGPIPDPETLSQYKNLYPESVKIIMDMAVKQADHRKQME